MRPIKFRAWDKADKRMVYQDWHSFRNWYNESLVGKVVYARGFDGEKILLSDPMQFTGLHDKNGKEIWEGDILLRKNGRVDVVEYETGSFVVRHPHGDSDYIAQTNMFEVIGNIYENPELLSPNNKGRVT